MERKNKTPNRITVKLTPKQVKNFRQWVNNAGIYEDAAKEIGVHPNTVSRIFTLGLCSPKTIRKIKDIINSPQ